VNFNVLDLLLPRETKFFTYMSQQADLLTQGCRVFHDLVLNIEQLSEDEIKKRLFTIKECETRGDAIEQTIIEELHKTFITPIDREDIHTLSINVDRALDILNSISRKIEIYDIRKVPSNVCRFSKIIVSISEQLPPLVEGLRSRKSIGEIVEKMHTLENEADELFHSSMAELFSKHTDEPTYIIKFKEFYEHLEHVVDSIDYVGKLVRGIKVKLG
jgi:uncharacterized protein